MVHISKLVVLHILLTAAVRGGWYRCPWSDEREEAHLLGILLVVCVLHW